MTGVRKSWRSGETTGANQTPAAVARHARSRIQAIPTRGAARIPTIAACRRANHRGTT
jgi:hypothetical protein